VINCMLTKWRSCYAIRPRAYITANRQNFVPLGCRLSGTASVARYLRSPSERDFFSNLVRVATAIWIQSAHLVKEWGQNGQHACLNAVAFYDALRAFCSQRYETRLGQGNHWPRQNITRNERWLHAGNLVTRSLLDRLGGFVLTQESPPGYRVKTP